MVNVNELKNKSIQEIIEILQNKDFTTVDLKRLGHSLKVSVLARNFERTEIPGERIICAFVTATTCLTKKYELLLPSLLQNTF